MDLLILWEIQDFIAVKSQCPQNRDKNPSSLESFEMPRQAIDLWSQVSENIGPRGPGKMHSARLAPANISNEKYNKNILKFYRYALCTYLERVIYSTDLWRPRVQRLRLPHIYGTSVGVECMRAAKFRPCALSQVISFGYCQMNICPPNLPLRHKRHF